MEVLFQILAILFLARIFGEISERIGLLSIVGEIAAGFVFAFFVFMEDTEVFAFFAQLGAIFLLFSAGYIKVHLKDLESTSKTALIPTFFQISISFCSGFLLGRMFGFGYVESLFMGVAFSPTSVSVVVRTLIDSDYLYSKPGSLMLTSTIFDDIVGIFFLSIMVPVATSSQLPPESALVSDSVKIVIFLLIMSFLGLKLLPLTFKYIQKMHTRESLFAFVVLIALFSAYLASTLGLHAAIGAFFGGVILSDLPLAKIESIQKKVNGLTYGFFTPIFFAFTGFSIEIALVGPSGIFTALVIVVALLSKLIGGYLGTRVIGFDNEDSLIFGIGMMPRSGVELVIITIGREIGAIREETFSAIVLMIVVSIIVSPLLLERAIIYKEQKTNAVMAHEVNDSVQ